MSRTSNLISLLERYHAQSDVDKRHVARMLELLDSAGDPFAREQSVPGHFTASGFVVSRTHQQLLLILHKKLNLWLQPGGHIESSDLTVEAAARREVTEETGLTQLRTVGDGLLDLDIHEIPAIAHTPAHLHFDVRFLFVTESDAYAAGSDALDARWYPFAEIPRVQSDASVLRAACRIQSLLGARST